MVQLPWPWPWERCACWIREMSPGPATVPAMTSSHRNGHRAGWLLLGAAALAAPLLSPAGVTTAAPHPPPLAVDGGVGLPFNPLLVSVSCPVERGPVKEGADADRFKVSTTVTTTSIAYLRARPKPASYPRNNRIAPNELHTWQLNAVLTRYKQESDGDIHLVLKDASGRAMIAEIPNPGCVPTTSRWKNQIGTARAAFTHTFSVSTSWHYRTAASPCAAWACSTHPTARPAPPPTASNSTPRPPSPSTSNPSYRPRRPASPQVFAEETVRRLGAPLPCRWGRELSAASQRRCAGTRRPRRGADAGRCVVALRSPKLAWRP